MSPACILALAVLGLLGACAAPTPATELKDHVTASDESEASRRARVRLELASAYFGRGQLNTALDEAKLAIASDPNLGAAFNLRGLIYASLGDERLAGESFRRALQINPRDADTMHNYAWVQCQGRRYAEAEALFSQALAVPQYRDLVRTLLAQGVCQARAGDLVRAERTLLRSYELDPANPTTAVNLSEVLYRRGDYERARFYVRRVNNQPEISNAQTLWLALRIERRAGNAEQAGEYGRQLRERFPQSQEAQALGREQFDD